jgi:hypothetical protein
MLGGFRMAGYTFRLDVIKAVAFMAILTRDLTMLACQWELRLVMIKGCQGSQDRVIGPAKMLLVAGGASGGCVQLAMGSLVLVNLSSNFGVALHT